MQDQTPSAPTPLMIVKRIAWLGVLRRTSVPNTLQSPLPTVTKRRIRTPAKLRGIIRKKTLTSIARLLSDPISISKTRTTRGTREIPRILTTTNPSRTTTPSRIERKAKDRASQIQS